MNVLIVDDNKNNRMILRLLLEDYMDENPNVEFEIDEAEDGLVAIEKCNKGNFDIVLMDIMMPNMDGIEATKKIRAQHPKIMIIAVSAVDDTERKKLILNYGAEDYIPKPVNADIFISRITNYITISESRKSKKVESAFVANLFTKKVFSRHLRFLITTEDSLSEFWEYYLLSEEIKPENFSDMIRTVFAIIELQRKMKINSDIFVEESEDHMFFTISNIDKLPAKVIELTMKKNGFQGDFKIDQGKISFRLAAVYPDLEFVESELMGGLSLKSEPKQEVAAAPTPTPQTSAQEVQKDIQISKSKELQIFNYMDSDDMIDVEEYIKGLSSILLVVGSGGVQEEEVDEICGYLERVSNVLSTYSEVFSISSSVLNLSYDIASHKQEFMTNSQTLGPLCKAFSNDLTAWYEKSFISGAPSADFMNDTIKVNCQTISSMISMNDQAVASEDFDDIFDF